MAINDTIEVEANGEEARSSAPVGASPARAGREWPRFRSPSPARRRRWARGAQEQDRDIADVPEGTSTASSASREAIYRRLLIGADLFAATAAFVVAIGVLGSDALGLEAVAAILSIVLVCKLTGIYDRDEHRIHKTTLDEAPALFRVATLYTLIIFLAGERIVHGTFGRGQALLFWAMLFCAMVLMRWAARAVAGAVVTEERCLILGGAEASNWLTTKLQRSHGTKAHVVGRVPLGPEPAVAGGSAALGEFDRLGALLRLHSIDRALVAPGPGDSDQRLLDAIRVLKRLGVRVSVLPRMFDAVGAAVEFDDIEGTILLGVRRHGLTRSSWILKRAFDLVVASVALVVLAPVFAWIALAIKLDSRGPVFFRQRRVGQGDEVFEIFKFRTMVADADSQRAALASRNEAGGGLFKIENDPRITRVGHYLRRTSLDELPQLINVMRGEMSTVGPRPLVIDEDSLIEGFHRHRLLVPPGVTGLWQIFGSARIPLDEMVKIDYLYGANWSLWLDVKILLRTIPFVVGRRGL